MSHTLPTWVPAPPFYGSGSGYQPGDIVGINGCNYVVELEPGTGREIYFPLPTDPQLPPYPASWLQEVYSTDNAVRVFEPSQAELDIVRLEWLTRRLEEVREL